MAGFINGFILFGAYLSILIFTGYILLRKTRNENIYHSLAFICFSLLLFKIYSVIGNSPAEQHSSWLFFLSIPYFPVPLLYFGYCRAVTFDDKLSVIKLCVLTPSLLVFLYDLSTVIFPVPENEILNGIIMAGALIQAIALLISLGIKLSVLYNKKEYFFIIRITMAYLVLTGAAYSLVIFGWILDITSLLQAGGTIVTVLLAGNYLMDLRNGKFRHLLIIEANKEKNKFTLFKGVDASQMIIKLESYMEESRLYLDENLSLLDLSQRLNLSTHQLSQLINDTYRMNFNTFINSYRIKEAKQLLRSSEEQTILSIAYGVGFNSKTAFYNAFSRITGSTPNKYRSSLEN
ncbi:MULTISPECIES: AraC family transcriptional regulator [unclassified Oceanispirochaeta]|uniref:helix-turn-helix domain-containing protein n=1 Tax=unclassified Oceanispirochaeta TaxID=2635722 RepID=UPI000E096D77|nr:MULTISPECIES: AraC family transcriptional regulator [unclassified Oceanispirochaeta]MBF9015982.1 helix-turn-helix transcriptional regulator [Oceanispirochaeta sp. M2]NPD72445.1 helix-turn-helix transcriptional regulator [Oceanispirochaeta sp. M1]RDG31906.1 AraC family transcriptional regulator [Oceanispirochaeta sp. M1]